jgi:hypothetical protein
MFFLHPTILSVNSNHKLYYYTVAWQLNNNCSLKKAMANNQHVLVVNEHHMLQLGIEYGGFEQTSDRTDACRFRKLYGIDPSGASKCFRDLQTTDIGEYKISKINPLNFLMTLYWVYGYGTETRVTGAFRLGSEKTCRQHVWVYLSAIQALKATKVSKAINL